MQELYRMIPKVDLFLQKNEMQILIREYGRNAVTEALREALAKLRRQAESMQTENLETENPETENP